jgi:hypothetical protein
VIAKLGWHVLVAELWAFFGCVKTMLVFYSNNLMGTPCAFACFNLYHFNHIDGFNQFKKLEDKMSFARVDLLGVLLWEEGPQMGDRMC